MSDLVPMQAVAAFKLTPDSDPVAVGAIVNVPADMVATLKGLGVIADPPTVDPTTQAGMNRVQAAASALGFGELVSVGEHLVTKLEEAVSGYKNATMPADSVHWQTEGAKLLAALSAFLK